MTYRARLILCKALLSISEGAYALASIVASDEIKRLRGTCQRRFQ